MPRNMPKSTRRPAQSVEGFHPQPTKLSKSFHSDPLVSPKSDHVVWDDQVRQLGLRTQNGARRWIVQTRINGKTKKRTLGRADDIHLSQARILATECLAQLQTAHQHIDPAISIDDFALVFLQDLKAQWKPNTYRANLSAIKNHVLPSLGKTKVRDLEHQDVLLWYNQINRAAGTRNRVLANLSTMMRHAEIVGIRQPGTNPCRHMRKHQSRFDADYLDAKTFAKLGNVLRQFEGRCALPVAFIWFLALTGCRKGEAEAAQWSQLEGNKLILPDSKTGPKTIWLGKQVVRLLRGLPRTSDFIFVSEDKKAQAEFNKSLKTIWSKVRQELKRPKLRLHDLRHSFASVAVNLNYDLRIVGGLLGHVDPDTTAGYANLNKKSVEQASMRVGNHLEKTLCQGGAQLKPASRRKQAPQNNLFTRYFKSKLRLDAFCKQEGLNAKQFHKDLVQWRQVTRGNKRRASK